jgi:predicted phage tail protein
METSFNQSTKKVSHQKDSSQMEEKMNVKKLFQNVVIFSAMAVAGICLIVFGQAAAASAVRGTLPFVGAALLAGGLAAFLVSAQGMRQ